MMLVETSSAHVVGALNTYRRKTSLPTIAAITRMPAPDSAPTALDVASMAVRRGATRPAGVTLALLQHLLNAVEEALAVESLLLVQVDPAVPDLPEELRVPALGQLRGVGVDDLHALLPVQVQPLLRLLADRGGILRLDLLELGDELGLEVGRQAVPRLGVDDDGPGHRVSDAPVVDVLRHLVEPDAESRRGPRHPRVHDAPLDGREELSEGHGDRLGPELGHQLRGLEVVGADLRPLEVRQGADRLLAEDDLARPVAVGEVYAVVLLPVDLVVRLEQEGVGRLGVLLEALEEPGESADVEDRRLTAVVREHCSHRFQAPVAEGGQVLQRSHDGGRGLDLQAPAGELTEAVGQCIDHPLVPRLRHREVAQAPDDLVLGAGELERSAQEHREREDDRGTHGTLHDPPPSPVLASPMGYQRERGRQYSRIHHLSGSAATGIFSSRRSRSTSSGSRSDGGP